MKELKAKCTYKVFSQGLIWIRFHLDNFYWRTDIMPYDRPPEKKMNQFQFEIILRKVAKVCFPLPNLSYRVSSNLMMLIQDYFDCISPEKIYLFKVNKRNTRKRYENDVNVVICVSLLLTLNTFHRFFYNFQDWFEQENVPYYRYNCKYSCFFNCPKLRILWRACGL